MYKITSQTQSLKGEIILPFSKSESNRALIIQQLTSQPFTIHNLSDADDTVILQQLLKSGDHVLNCGDGGTTLRFLVAYLALQGEDKIITGSNRLCNRPVKPLVDTLNKLGASVSYLEKEDFPPLKISKGNFSKVNSIGIKADISSQFISAILMIAPLLPEGLIITLEGKILSKPYLHLTLKMMHWFGIDYSFEKNIISILPQTYRAKDIIIGADWTAASYFYEMAAMAQHADLLLIGLSNQSAQGDLVLTELMRQFGIDSIEEKNGIRIIKKPDAFLPAEFEYDFTDCPDLAQTFAILCAALNIQSKLTGLDNLAIKETNRLSALQNEITKLGKKVLVDKNSLMFFESNGNISVNQVFKSYGDHRMVMALTPMALRLPSIYLSSIEDVSKSYPNSLERSKQTGNRSLQNLMK